MASLAKKGENLLVCPLSGEAKFDELRQGLFCPSVLYFPGFEKRRKAELDCSFSVTLWGN